MKVNCRRRRNGQDCEAASLFTGRTGKETKTTEDMVLVICETGHTHMKQLSNAVRQFMLNVKYSTGKCRVADAKQRGSNTG